MSASENSIKQIWIVLLSICGAAVISFGLTANGFSLCESLPAHGRDLGAATFAPILMIEKLMGLFSGWKPGWNPLSVFLIIWLFYSLLFLAIVRFGRGRVTKKTSSNLRS